MQSTHRCLIALGLLLGSVAVHPDMAALQSVDDMPERCQANDRAQQGYQRGVDVGKLIVNQAWDTVSQDCRQLDRLVSILARTFESLHPASQRDAYRSMLARGDRSRGDTGIAGFGAAMWGECVRLSTDAIPSETDVARTMT